MDWSGMCFEVLSLREPDPEKDSMMMNGPLTTHRQPNPRWTFTSEMIDCHDTDRLIQLIRSYPRLAKKVVLCGCHSSWSSRSSSSPPMFCNSDVRISLWDGEPYRAIGKQHGTNSFHSHFVSYGSGFPIRSTDPNAFIGTGQLNIVN